MYRGEQSQLGFAPLALTETIFNVAALKNLLGIGKKKRARAKNVEENKGVWVGQFPPDVSFEDTLNLSPAVSGLGKKAGAKNLREDYAALYAHKDSWLVKNKVASPEDYAAYTVITDINGARNLVDPKETNPGSAKYKRAPQDGESGINIFDEKRLKAYYAKIAAAEKHASPPSSAIPQPINYMPEPTAAQLPPPPPQPSPYAQPQFDYRNMFAQTQSAADAAPKQKALAQSYVMPVMLGAAALGAFVLLSDGPKRKRR